MKQKIMAAAVCIGLIAAIGWAVSKANSLKPGASVNNGYNTEFSMPSPELRKKMEDGWKNRKPEDMRRMSDPSEMGKMQEQFIDKLPDAQQVEMRDMMKRMQEQRDRMQAVMSPEEQKVMMKKFMEMMRSRRSPFGSRGGDGENKPAPETK